MNLIEAKNSGRRFRKNPWSAWMYHVAEDDEIRMVCENKPDLYYQLDPSDLDIEWEVEEVEEVDKLVVLLCARQFGKSVLGVLKASITELENELLDEKAQNAILTIANQ